MSGEIHLDSALPHSDPRLEERRKIIELARQQHRQSVIHSMASAAITHRADRVVSQGDHFDEFTIFQRDVSPAALNGETKHMCPPELPEELNDHA